VALRLQRTLPVSIEGREIERVEISDVAVVVRLRNGRVVAVRPGFFDEIEACRPGDGGFLDCVAANLRLEVEWR